MRTRHTALTIATTLAAVACAATDSTSPGAGPAASVSDATRGAAATADTGRTPAPSGPSRVGGRVRVATWRAPGQGSADTTQHTPVAGATLRLHRNVLVDGRGVSRFVAQTTSAADGSYSFGQIEGGYYLVYTSVPGIAGEHLDYLAATSANVTLDVTVWRREGAAADSTGG